MLEELIKKLAREVEQLQYKLNVTLPAEIRRAVEMGDLKENSEYKAALERQALVQARLQLTSELGKDPDTWHWGQLHRLRMLRPSMPCKR